MHDAIVIGTDLSSLVASAVISRHGLKTALVSETDAKQIYSNLGYTFNIDPSPLTGFGSGQTCSRLLEDLGISVAEWSGLKLLNPGLQIILSDHRVDCFHSRHELLHDMEREFPDYGDEIRKLYTSVFSISDLMEEKGMRERAIRPPKSGDFLSFVKVMPTILKEKLSLLRRYKSIINNPSLLRVFEAENAIFSNSNNLTSPFSMSSARALSLPLRGLYHHVGGIEALRGLLKSAFANFGGHLIENYPVSNINAGREIEVDIFMQGEPSQLRGRYLIASTKWGKIGLLHPQRKFRRIEQRLKSIKSAYYPFTLHIGIFERCIPERMATYAAFIVDQDRPVADDNLVFVELSASGCKERAPLGKRALSATVMLKRSPVDMMNDELEKVAELVLCSLERFLPFLRDNLDLLDVGKSIELSRDCQKFVHQKYELRSRLYYGQSNISNAAPFRNVFLTGGMLHPGLGFEGEIISGLNAANLILSKERGRHE